ncbi:MAG: tetratricopeptide repeat protein [Bryobacteraceae bacterium]|jgi:hypothetical protein
MSGRIHDLDPDEIGFLDELAGSAPRTERPPAVCPSPARLQAFSAGALPEEQKQAMDLHLTGCAACRRLVQDLAQWPGPAPEPRDVDTLWRRLQQQLPKQHRRWAPWRTWTYRTWLPVAAAAAMSLLLTVNLLPVLSSTVAPPRPRMASIASPAYDLWAIAAVEKPPLRLPLDGLLLWRGSGQPSPPASTREIAAALAPYEKGDFREAADRLAPLASRYPEIFEVAFYRGVCLLLTGRPEDAVAPLAQARTLGDPAQREEASWYLSLAHLRAGTVRQARPHLEQLCSGGALHSASACLALRQLASPAFASPQR